MYWNSHSWREGWNCLCKRKSGYKDGECPGYNGLHILCRHQRCRTKARLQVQDPAKRPAYHARLWPFHSINQPLFNPLDFWLLHQDWKSRVPFSWHPHRWGGSLIAFQPPITRQYMNIKQQLVGLPWPKNIWSLRILPCQRSGPFVTVVPPLLFTPSYIKFI